MDTTEMDRRRFLERSAAAGAAITLGSSFTASAAEETGQGEPPPRPSPQGGGSMDGALERLDLFFGERPDRARR